MDTLKLNNDYKVISCLQDYSLNKFTVFSFSDEQIPDTYNIDDVEKVTEEGVIDPYNYDYSDIVVVLGNNYDTKEIVDIATVQLQELGITVYNSDSTKVTSVICVEASIENPEKDLIAINISKSNSISNEVVANYRDGIATVDGPYNSDSLVAVLASEIKDSRIVSGNLSVKGKIEREPSIFENEIRKMRVQNPRVKSLSLNVKGKVDSSMIADAIVDTIIKYEDMTPNERNRAIYGQVLYHPEFAKKDSKERDYDLINITSTLPRQCGYKINSEKNKGGK